MREDTQLLACFIVGVLLFLQMDLSDLVFRNSFGDTGMRNEARLKESSSIPKSLLGKMTTRCGNWNPSFSKSRISFVERFVPIFTGHMLGMSGLDCTHFCLMPLI